MITACGSKITPANEADTDTDTDTDTDADADADADTDTDTDTDTNPQGGPGSMACPDEEAMWRISGPAGSATIRVDTVSAADTFDPYVRASQVTTWSANPVDVVLGAQIAYADDTFDCTFPPPSFRCPEAIGTVDGSDFAVVVSAFGNCVGPTAGYSLTVTIDGTPATATFLGNFDGGLDTGSP